MTVGAWVRRRDSGRWQVLVGKPGDGRSKLENYGLWLDESDRAVAFFGDGERYLRVETPAPLDDDWHSLVATYDGARAVLYLDGIQVATTPGRVELTPNDGALNIGRARDGTSFFKGSLDLVAVLPRALRANEVERLHLSAVTDDAQATPGNAHDAGLGDDYGRHETGVRGLRRIDRPRRAPRRRACLARPEGGSTSPSADARSALAERRVERPLAEGAFAGRLHRPRRAARPGRKPRGESTDDVQGPSGNAGRDACTRSSRQATLPTAAPMGTIRLRASSTACPASSSPSVITPTTGAPRENSPNAMRRAGVAIALERDRSSAATSTARAVATRERTSATSTRSSLPMAPPQPTPAAGGTATTTADGTSSC